MKTFKQFNESLDNEIEKLVKFVDIHNYRKNLISCLKEDLYLWRGFDSDVLGDDYFVIKYKRDTSRKSIYSGHQSIMSMWKTFDMPSREQARFCTPEKRHASEFAYNSRSTCVVIPKDDTVLFGLDEDFNYSFKKQTTDFFNLPDYSIGDLASAFDEAINELIKASDKNYGILSEYNKINNSIVEVDKQFFKKLDNMIESASKQDDRGLSYITKKLIQHHKKGTMSEEVFRQYFKACSGDIKVSLEVGNIIKKLNLNSGSPEVWFSSDMLLLSSILVSKTLRPQLLKALEDTNEI